MKKRERWRPGLTLDQSQIITIRNVLRAAKRAGDLAYAKRLRALLLVGLDRFTTEGAGKILEVGAPCIYGWCRKYRQGGVEALKTRKQLGKKPRLSAEQKDRLKSFITKGPEANGFDTGVWNAVLVQQLIQKRFKVDYHVTHVRRILHKLGFSVQYPKKVLSEANLQQQKQWLRHEYPEIKKKRKKRVASCSSKTNASSSRKEQ